MYTGWRSVITEGIVGELTDTMTIRKVVQEVNTYPREGLERVWMGF